MDAEFDQLYAHLRLTPACSLDELHRAFRRAVSELHPDRGGAVDGEAQARLRELIRLHARATAFHRRHGRLPGANPGLGPGLAFAASTRSATRARRNSALKRWLLVLPLLAFVAWQLAFGPR